MKKTHFKFGLLTACLISVGSVASAQTCGAESCGRGACKCSKKHCDDKGLLEVINNAASNFEATLASMIPDRDRALAKSLAVKSPCNCAKCNPPSDFATRHTEVAPSHLVEPKSFPHIATPIAQPDVVRPHMPRLMPPPNAIDPVSVPHSGTHNVVPLPDTRNNPFKDDPIPTTRNLLPVPGRPASFLRSSNIVQAEFDPQASNQQAIRSVLISKVASKTISDSSNGLAKTTSTRRAQPLAKVVSAHVERSFLEQAPPEVVPASLSVPVSGLRNLTAVPPAADQFVNPLRAQQ